MKLATLLFSGCVAALAIARAGLAGCGQAPPAPAQGPAKASPAAPTTPSAAPAVAPTPAPTPVQVAPNAAPEPSREPPPQLPRRYLGGSKSDVDVWSTPEPPALPAGQKPTKRGER
jgi:hypothetical protein